VSPQFCGVRKNNAWSPIPTNYYIYPPGGVLVASAAYDAFAEQYADRVPTDLDSSLTVEGLATRHLLVALGDVKGQDVLDLGCGEGHVARRLAVSGGKVTGLDLSSELLRIARQRSSGIEYVCGDAQDLQSFRDSCFDLVYSNLALMDIPDLVGTYRAVRRVLRPTRRFVFTLVHPCFCAPGGDVLTDEDGRFLARTVARYTEEGFWRSDGVGTVRSTVGAHHRRVSTYVNELLAVGFNLRRLVEPTLPPADYARASAQCYSKIPPVLLVEAVRD